MTFSCELDGAGFTACTSPKAYSGLADGFHTFKVKAIDAADNPGPPTTYVWRIDTTAPDTAIDAGPDNPTNATGASLAFTATEGGSTFACRLDGASWAACSSPESYSGLAEGSHTFEVRATDALGNTDSTPASATWLVDTTAPVVTIGSAPADPSSSTDPTLGFGSGEGGTTFECALDGGAFSACTSPSAYSGLAEGGHTFQVKGTDLAGNVSAVAAPRMDDRHDGAGHDDRDRPDRPDQRDGRKLRLLRERGRIDVRLPDRRRHVVGLLDAERLHRPGRRRAHVRRAGHRPGRKHGRDARRLLLDRRHDARPSPRSGRSRPTRPTTPRRASPSRRTRARPSSATSTGTGSPPAPARPRTRGSTRGATRSRSGPPTRAGTRARPRRYTWTLDTAAPTATIGTKPPDPSSSAAPSFGFSADEPGSTFLCRLDGGVYAACTSPTAYTGLAEGSHTFQVSATDPAGNAGPAASHTWTVDTVPPAPSITSTPADPTNATAASFQFTSGEPGSAFRCRLDGGAYAACTSPAPYTGLGHGSHTFTVEATDEAGNSATASFVWAVDLVAPGATITTRPPAATPQFTATFEFTSEPGATFECELDGAGFSGCSSPEVLTGLADGSHTFEVRATDGVGNTGASADYTWIVDATLPTGSLTEPAGGATIGGTAVHVAAEAFDPGGSGVAAVTFQRRPDGGSFTDIATDSTSPFEATWSAAALPSGAYELRAVVVDLAGNTFTTGTTAVTVDSTAPPVALADPGAVVSGVVALGGTTTGTDTDHVVFAWRVAGGTTWTEIGTATVAPYGVAFDTTGLAEGLYDIRATAFDVFGNSATDVRPAARVDNLQPALVSSTPAGGSTVLSAASIGLVASESLAGIDGATLDGAAAPAPAISGTNATFATGLLAPGAHTLAGTLRDLAGKTTAFTVGFTVAYPPLTLSVRGPAPLKWKKSVSIALRVTLSRAAAVQVVLLKTSGAKAKLLRRQLKTGTTTVKLKALVRRPGTYTLPGHGHRERRRDGDQDRQGQDPQALLAQHRAERDHHRDHEERHADRALERLLRHPAGEARAEERAGDRGRDRHGEHRPLHLPPGQVAEEAGDAEEEADDEVRPHRALRRHPDALEERGQAQRPEDQADRAAEQADHRARAGRDQAWIAPPHGAGAGSAGCRARCRRGRPRSARAAAPRGRGSRSSRR